MKKVNQSEGQGTIYKILVVFLLLLLILVVKLYDNNNKELQECKKAFEKNQHCHSQYII